jgi:hypothetical protein
MGAETTPTPTPMMIPCKIICDSPFCICFPQPIPPAELAYQTPISPFECRGTLTWGTVRCFLGLLSNAIVNGWLTARSLFTGGAVAVFVVDTVWKCDLPRTSPSILGPVQASNQLFRRTTVIPCVVLLLALPRSFYFNSCYFYHFSPRFGFPLRGEDLVHFT